MFSASNYTILKFNLFLIEFSMNWNGAEELMMLLSDLLDVDKNTFKDVL